MKTKLFEKYPEIKLVYLFGSRAEGKEGPISDYDFAVYFDEKTPSIKRSDIKLELNGILTSLLKTNRVDIVILNDDVGSFLKYQAIRGKLIYNVNPYKIIAEPQILSEYFDFQVFFNKHNL
ncbi:MAG: nucleotidyltransferase domain-containing protein [Patescibacteria group bacterium]